MLRVAGSDALSQQTETQIQFKMKEMNTGSKKCVLHKSDASDFGKQLRERRDKYSER